MSPDSAGRRHSTQPRRILVVDDHPIVRFGLIEQVRQNRPQDHLAEAEDHTQALHLLKTEPFDLMVCDLSLRETGGLDLIKQARTLYPKLQVLVVSMHDEQIYGPRALKAGARGYIMKQEAPGQLLGAIESVMSGGTFLSQRLAQTLAETVAGNKSAAPRYSLEALTDRELEIFRLIGEGLAPREISARLHLSVKTVAAHRDNIKSKLNLESAQKLTQFASQWHILESGSRSENPKDP